MCERKEYINTTKESMTMKPNKFIICLLLIIFNQYIFCEDLTIAPFPNSQAEQQYPQKTEIKNYQELLSVDHYTGQLNLQIPLYTINSYDLSHSISIKYRSGGYKVDVEDGYLGYDWDLICGGEITRELVGYPDEFHTIHGWHNMSANERRFINMLLKQDRDYDFDDTGVFLLIPDSIRQLEGPIGENRYMSGYMDCGPDIYHFNIGTITGIFIIYAEDNIIVQCDQKVEISRINTNNFKITDTNGRQYIFSDRESQLYKFWAPGVSLKHPDTWYVRDTCSEPYTSAWKLSRIISPCNDTIAFEYGYTNRVDSAFESSKTNMTGYHLYYFDHPCHNSSSANFSDIYSISTSDGLSFATRKENETMAHRTYLKTIKSNNVKINFTYDSTQYWIPKLTSIIVYRGKRNQLNGSDLNALQHKKYIFNYAANEVLYEAEYNTCVNYKLTQILEYGTNTNKAHIYSLTYYPVNEFYRRFDQSHKDHWGYAQENAKTFASSMYSFNNDPIFDNDLRDDYENPSYFGDRSAETDSASCRSGSLKTITFPTGLKAEFIWEPHTYGKVSYLYAQSPTLAQMYWSYQEEDKYITKTHYINGIDTTCTFSVSPGDSIIINARGYYGEFNIEHSDCDNLGLPSTTLCYCIPAWQDESMASYYYVKRNDNSLVVLNRMTESFFRNQTGIYKYVVPENTYKITINLHINPNEIGTKTYYCYEIYNALESNRDGYRTIEIQHKYLKLGNVESNTEGHAGGVRIRQINYYSEQNAKPYKKFFNYHALGTVYEASSNGVLTKAPQYDYINFVSHNLGAPHCRNGLLPGLTYADPMYFFMKGYHVSAYGMPRQLTYSPDVEYSLVTEFDGGSATNNREAALILGDLNLYPPIINNNSANGELSYNIKQYSFETSENQEKSDEFDTKNMLFAPMNQVVLTSHQHLRGHMTQSEEYINGLKQTTQYSYDIIEKTQNPYIPASLFVMLDASTTAVKSIFEDENSDYIPSDFGIVRYRLIPYNKRIREINVLGVKSKKITYHYLNEETNTYSDSPLANCPTQECTIEDGNMINKYYTYVQINNIVRVNSIVITCNDILRSVERYNYNSQGQMIEKYIGDSMLLTLEPIKITALQVKNSIHLPTFVTEIANQKSESYQYDSHNRLVEIYDHLDNIKTSYLWGYDGEFIVAELKDCAYGNILSHYPQLPEQSYHKYYTIGDEVEDLLDVRQLFPDALVTTFTYDLKYGMTSVTNPDKQKTIYSYDSFGNLTNESTINLNNQIVPLQQYQIHYRLDQD